MFWSVSELYEEAECQRIVLEVNMFWSVSELYWKKRSVSELYWKKRSVMLWMLTLSMLLLLHNYYGGGGGILACVPVVRCAMFASTATASDMEGVLHCAGATSSYRHACYFHVSFFHFHSCCCMLMCVEYLYRVLIVM